MKSKTLCLALLVVAFFILQVPILAQDATSTPAPWPPDPKTLFTDHVTIVEDQSPEPQSTQANEPIPSKCGTPIERYYSDSNWHFYIDPQTKQVRFCEATTGKLTDPLPSDISFWDAQPPSTSPDGQWLAFWGAKLSADGTVDSYLLYSYEIETGKINHLGEIKSDSFKKDVYVSEWVDNRHGAVIQGGGPEVFGKSVLSFNVEKEDSLQFAISGWPTFIDDPPRYEYLETKQYLQWKTGSVMGNDVPCTLSTYDKYGYHVHNLAKACLPLSLLNSIGEDQYEYITRVGDLYFFKPFDETDKNSTQKISTIDVSNGEVRDIFYGQADLLSVSPDGKYLIQVIDHSILALYNIANEHVIFAAENPDEQYNSLGTSYVVQWLGDYEVLIYAPNKSGRVTVASSGDIYLIGLPASLRLIRINADETTSVVSTYDDRMSEPQDISPNAKYVLTGDSLYNLLTNSHFRILTDIAKQYDIRLNWIDNTHIYAVVHLKDNYKAFTLVFDESY